MQSPNSCLTILTLAKHTFTIVPYHEDVRSVKDARSSSLQILATGTVASGLSRLVQRCQALILHEGS